jgi:hypothetical protein
MFGCTVINDQSVRSRKLEEFVHRLGPSFNKISEGMKDLHDQRAREEEKKMKEAALDQISSFAYHARYTQILQLRMDSTCEWASRLFANEMTVKLFWPQGDLRLDRAEWYTHLRAPSHAITWHCSNLLC